jgi:hypothetical protein
MQENFFNAHTGLTDLHWWLGQIVDDSTWRGNEKRTKWKNPTEIPGYGTRCKVRIFGRDSTNKDTPDDQLEMAELLYPVTAGSGHGGGYQSTNLSHGTYVIGFYKDGVDATEPIILGCLGNNEQTKLSRNIPLKGFVPTSGHNGKGVPYYSIPPGGSPPVGGSDPLEGNSGSRTLQDNICDQQQYDDGKQKCAIQSKCDPAELSAVQKKIKQLIKDIENAKKQVKDWKNTALKPINYKGQQMSVSDYIQMKINNAAKDITAFFKNIIDGTRKFVTEKVNNTMKDTYYNLYPNERPKLKKTAEQVNDTLSCLFNKIISNLLKMIGKALLAMADQVLNVAECLVNNFVGGLLGKLVGLISSVISAILKPIEALVGGVFDIGVQILDFVGQLLGFLTCEEKPSCGNLKEWSIWDAGGANTTLNFDNLFNTVQTFASNAQKVTDPDNFNFDLDFSDIFQNSCFTGPLLCGPPNVVFYGGGGQGAAANAIISSVGNIIGIDIVASGFGYTKPPFIRFEDACGKGNGAVGRVLIGPVTGPDGQPTNGVVNVVIEQSGTGYLSSPNGDMGGDGRVWANRCQSTIHRTDGTWDTPYDEGEIMSIRTGDTVKLAGQPEYVATEDQSITASGCPPDDPQVGNTGSSSIQPSSTIAEYPVVMYLCNTQVANSGVAYSTTDRIVVLPDKGAVLEPVFGAFGSIESIKVVSSGIGYTALPEISIESDTGYNAKILPVLCVNRVGDIPQDQVIIPPGETIIHVVDCVGKV